MRFFIFSSSKRFKILFVCIFNLVFSLSLLARECYNCGAKIDEDSNNCYSCGAITTGGLTIKKKKPETPKAVKKPQKKPVAKKVSNPVPKKELPVNNNAKEIKEQTISNTIITPVKKEVDEYAYLVDYSFINDIEKLLTETSYKSAEGQLKLLQSQNSGRLAALSNSYPLMTTYKKKMHDLHLEKLKYLEEYFAEWKNENLGINKGFSIAKKDMKLYMISRINEAIDVLLCGESESVAIEQASIIEQAMKQFTEIYIITSPYLTVSNQKLKRSEPFWVSKINNNSVLLVHLGLSKSSQPLTGFISVEEMEKRTNWRLKKTYAYSTNKKNPTISRKREQIQSKGIFSKNYPYLHFRPRSGYCYSIIPPTFWEDTL